MNKLIIVALAGALVASANATYMKLTGLGRGQTVSIKYNGSSKSVFSGELFFKNLSTNANFTTMCIDLDHGVNVGQQWHFTTSDSQSADALRKAAGNVYANGIGSVSNNSDAAALQIAVWSARYGLNLNTNIAAVNGFRLSNSWYSSNTSIVNKAKTYLLAAGTQTHAIIYTPNPTNSGQEQVAVPEPASMIALGLGAAAMLRRRRK